MMNRNFNRGKKFAFFFPVAVLIALVLGYVVMFLWNLILPEAAHAGKLNYWQALGLLVLCRILFGNFGRGGGCKGRPGFGRGGRYMREKWHNMNPNERAKFRSEWRERCKQRNQRDSR
ncbi:hypothetical protein [Pedobacter punctiformis]|uniref:DUF4133 domain-containing protein n=1 Tax=Pedobacter punctiformis TaxID=3004097 RepID=A0ABT4L596_9SPHI|nr:hypothetical protein [Pedobacter sp. HCMS5-2]MCZ4243080.1 hypothetical protein [Pedobacter sp. HCMS5-2]